MQFTFVTVVLSFVAATFATSVSFDPTYDQASASLGNVACSDGSNGLITKGFDTFGSLKNFPNIGGAAAVEGWNSAACGTCWKLTYNGQSINVLAIDVAIDGFNVSEEAMNTLTGGQAEQLGRVDATVEQLDASACGL
ncbi:unnamed protein product [Somion occarium]|uniref:Cerato-platanin n=1 Tax=Somion occarium TaxID=3059160 RepID=A0ABP1D5Q4_9APHY